MQFTKPDPKRKGKKECLPLCQLGLTRFELAFPTERDSATFLDKGKEEVSLLSRKKKTAGQAQIRDGTGWDFDRLSRDFPGWNSVTIIDFSWKCLFSEKDVLKQKRTF